MTLTPTSAGQFTVSNVPAGTYSLGIKGYRWLQVAVPLDTTGGNVSGIMASLPSGDSNNDNSCDVLDFGILVNAYGGKASVSGSGYDVKADFNDDGSVDVLDFGILVNNYGSKGDL